MGVETRERKQTDTPNVERKQQNIRERRRSKSLAIASKVHNPFRRKCVSNVFFSFFIVHKHSYTSTQTQTKLGLDSSLSRSQRRRALQSSC
uniref:Uncharacterized protein n=1 Tax=Anopheles dirus TaxID=7168 RepID=A0A182NWB6_9DIPT